MRCWPRASRRSVGRDHRQDHSLQASAEHLGSGTTPSTRSPPVLYAQRRGFTRRRARNSPVMKGGSLCMPGVFTPDIPAANAVRLVFVQTAALIAPRRPIAPVSRVPSGVDPTFPTKNGCAKFYAMPGFVRCRTRTSRRHCRIHVVQMRLVTSTRYSINVLQIPMTIDVDGSHDSIFISSPARRSIPSGSPTWQILSTGETDVRQRILDLSLFPVAQRSQAIRDAATSSSRTWSASHGGHSDLSPHEGDSSLSMLNFYLPATLSSESPPPSQA